MIIRNFKEELDMITLIPLMKLLAVTNKEEIVMVMELMLLA